MEELEKRKLQLEIAKLNTPWYRSLEFWKVVIPTIAILASLYFTVGQGVIDSEKRKLELQKEQLKLEILQFGITKKEIEESIKLSTLNEKELNSRIIELTRKKDSLSTAVQQLFRTQNSLKSENEEIRGEYAKDKGFYQNELKKQYQLEKSYLTDLDRERENLNSLKVTVAETNAELEFYRKKFQLSALEKYELADRKIDATIKEREKQSNEFKKRIEQLSKEYEHIKKKIDTMSSFELQKQFELYFLKEQ